MGSDRSPEATKAPAAIIISDEGTGSARQLRKVVIPRSAGP